ncbi:hypothetical protein I4U23_010793 [Adineta vaga]|nr:hypothetical protein I4U23_010793 [Adineta vaga]
MPRTPRCKCCDCERVLDSNQVREVGSGLLRLFLTVRLSKRIRCHDTVCQRCRSLYLKWQQEMDGDFEEFDHMNDIETESINFANDSGVSIGADDYLTGSNGDVETQSNCVSIPVFRCSNSHHQDAVP